MGEIPMNQTPRQRVELQRLLRDGRYELRLARRPSASWKLWLLPLVIAAIILVAWVLASSVC